MKKCQSCNFENADDMRFCVECGMPLPASPMVINLQNPPSQGQTDVKNPAFEKSMETQIGSRNQNMNPAFPVNSPAKRRSYSKIFLVLGGVFALGLLLLTAGAAIIYFNWKPDEQIVKPSKSPTPSPTRTVEKPTQTPTPKPPPSVLPSPDITPPTASDDAPGGTFDKMWVDYNVTEKGELGMRIHISFSALNLKDVESDVLVRFQKKDGSYLLTNNKAYQSNNGETTAAGALKPAFDNAVYKDLQLFIPYDEFNLSRGKYNLKMDVDLTYRNGDFIQHFTFYDFEYEEK